MGILGRINNVIKSNVNDLLDKMTDPEKEVDLLIHDMEENVRKAKEEVLQCLATSKRGAMRVAKAQEEAARWQSRAEQAVQASDDELAREALKRKMASDHEVEEAKKSHAEQDAYAANLKSSLKQLEARLEDVKLRKGTLKMKAKAAKEGRGPMSGGKAFAEFDRLEDRIEEIEATADLSDSLEGKEAATEAKFARLERAQGNPEVEDALALLKAKMSEGQ